MDLVEHTAAMCGHCSAVLPGRLVGRHGDVFLERTCPEHGHQSDLYYRDLELYRALSSRANQVACCDTYDCVSGPCTRRVDDTLIYMVNVTNNCNMTCASCLSRSDAKNPAPFASVSELIGHLPEASRLPVAPQVLFFGGEPTLHPELPAMIRDAKARGFVPRLASNGIKLGDPEYLRSLTDAGLDWVFLHFDSNDEELNARIRGRPMVEVCMAAVRECQRAGVRVQFGVTVSSENLHELGQIIETAREAGVFWISLYPLAEIERTAQRPIFLADVLHALEEQTRGAVRATDFVRASRLFSLLARITRRANYRQKPTMVSLPIIFDRDRLVPVSRLLRPSGFAYPRAAYRLFRSMRSLVDYQRRAPSGHTMVLSIQQLQGRRAFDIGESRNSHMSYVHQGSYVPFDVYNHVHRYARTE